MKKIVFLALAACFFIFSDCLALEWKKLHEQADKQDLVQSVAAVQNNPSVENNYILGLAYLNQHRDKEAEQVFRKVIENDPSAIEAEWGIAEVLRRQHKLRQAEKMLNKIIQTQATFYPAYISLAYIKYIQMDFEQSVRLALKVMQAGKEKVDLSNYVRAYCLYAGAKGMLAHYGGPFSKLVNGLAVKSNLDTAQKLQPNAAGVLFGLGSFYLLAPRIAGGNPDKSETYLKKAINVDPHLSDAYVRLAQLYKLKGNSAAFTWYLDKALTLDPGNELALDTQSGACKYICAGS